MGRVPRAVIFDWGGVMTRRAPGAARIAFERRLGLEAGGRAPSSTRSMAAVQHRSAATGELLDPGMRWVSRPARHVYGGRALDASVRSPASEAAARGPHQPASRRGEAWAAQQRADLRQQLGSAADLFDDIMISAEVGLRKPQPEIFELVLGRLGVQPNEALFIDDLQRNVDAARLAGLLAHRFVGPGPLKLLLARRGLVGDTLDAVDWHRGA